MADSAFQTMYRRETVQGFEKRSSLVRKSVTTEFMKEGGSAVFLVADSGGATAVTRGLNGDIPTRPDNNTAWIRWGGVLCHLISSQMCPSTGTVPIGTLHEQHKHIRKCAQ